MESPLKAPPRAAALGNASAFRIEEHKDERGSIRLWQCAPNLYATRVVGHLPVEHARKLIAYADPLFEQGRVLGFHDWFRMTGYDTASRNELTAWSLRRRALAQLNIGTADRIVGMGVSVAALALGKDTLRQFSDVEALERAFAAALGR